MDKVGLIGHKGMCGKELLSLLPSCPIIFHRNSNLDFENINILFMAINAKDSISIAKKAVNEGVTVIDLSSAHRNFDNYPLILPTINSHLINNSLKLLSLPNCVVSILLTALGPLHKISPIKKIILSTYQAASGAGKVGLEAINSDEKISPFPFPLRNNIFLHESEKNISGLCDEEEKIIFETRKLLQTPSLPISVRCVRLPIKRVHSIHAIVSFEQNIHNIEKVIETNPYIQMHSSPNPLQAEKSRKVFIGPIRKDPYTKNTYDFWIVGDQLMRGAALNAFEAYQEIKKCSLIKS